MQGKLNWPNLVSKNRAQNFFFHFFNNITATEYFKCSYMWNELTQ